MFVQNRSSFLNNFSLHICWPNIFGKPTNLAKIMLEFSTFDLKVGEEQYKCDLKRLRNACLVKAFFFVLY